MEKKYLDNNGLAHLWLLIKEKINNKVDKVEGKGLSTNDLTDELVTKINNAGDSTFTGDYNDLTNKPDLTVYATTEETNTAITNATKDFLTGTAVDTKIANAVKDITSFDYSVVTSLPTTGVKGTIYLVSNSGTGNNIYDEYIYVSNKFEKIGTTEVNLSGYMKDTDLVAITNSEIDTMLGE